MFHHFCFGNEPLNASRERLKRQCDWLHRNYNLITLRQARLGLAGNNLPTNPLLVTIDDAKIQLLSVLDIFRSFEVPICVFACVGWSARETRVPGPDVALAALVANIEWYRSAPFDLQVGSKRLTISAGDDQRAQAVDAILACPEPGRLSIPPELDWAEQNRGRVCCSLDELASIACDQVAIGAHSISHIRLGDASATRVEYEVGASRKILTDVIGQCPAFAYPYGMRGTFNETSDRAIKKAGFELAFLTHSDLISSGADPHKLPRISMPDRAMSHVEFCMRAAGAGIVYRKFKDLLRNAGSARHAAG